MFQIPGSGRSRFDRFRSEAGREAPGLFVLWPASRSRRIALAGPSCNPQPDVSAPSVAFSVRVSAHEDHHARDLLALGAGRGRAPSAFAPLRRPREGDARRVHHPQHAVHRRTARSTGTISNARSTFVDRGGCSGIVWPQGSSSVATLTKDERLHGMEVLAKAAKGKRLTLVLGVQGKDTAEMLEYARRADALGTDAMIAMPPTTGKSMDDYRAYFRALGGATTRPSIVQTSGGAPGNSFRASN